MPTDIETESFYIKKYQDDYIFHNKVESLAMGVMAILDKHISGKNDSIPE